MILISLLLWAAPVQARWMTEEEAGSVVENYLIEYDVQKNGASVQLVDYTVRVQGEDAKTSAGQFTIDYNSATDKVEVIEAYTINGKDQIAVEPGMIEDRDKGKAKDYDAIKVRSLAFPQVQIGSRIHIRYKITTSKPVLMDRWATQITFSPGLFIDKVVVRLNSEVPLFYKARDPGKLAQIRQKDKFHLEITNKKPLTGWVHAEKDPYFHPQRFTEIVVSTHKDWKEYFSTLNQDVETVLSKPLPQAMRLWVSGAKGEKDAKAKIMYLMEKMSEEYHYFGDWRRHDGGVVPRTLAEIEKSRFGDCKDLSSMLTAMLRALGIEANLTLVRRGENPWGEEPAYDLPSLNEFNHAIVQAKADGKVYWLDATNPVASIEPYSDIAGRAAWVLDPKNPRFDRLPVVGSMAFLHVHEYEYKFDGADNVRVRVKADLKGMASFRIANDLLMNSRSDVLSDTLEYLSEGQELHSFHYVKEPATKRELKDMEVVLEYEAGRVTFDAGKDAFYVIPDGFLAGAFYETEARESDMRLAEEPFVFRGTRRLKDTVIKQSVPEPCRIQSEWMDLERRIEVQEKDVVILQNVDLKKPYITRDEFRSPAFKKLQKATRECFYRSGVLIASRKGTL